MNAANNYKCKCGKTTFIPKWGLFNNKHFLHCYTHEEVIDFINKGKDNE